MTPQPTFKTYPWLLPLSWLYGLGVAIRNWLFDKHVLKEQSFDLPVINVGNLTVGGTGKTPHVEYLIRLLSPVTQVAVLSRGYKRKTTGYRLATDSSTSREIGDEPYQMKLKFPQIHVAVDEHRPEGITRLTTDEATADTGVVILDDAFQHRYVKPGVNILLTDYNRLFINDLLLPAGRLREPASGKKRANIVIVTKCPKTLKPMDFRVLAKQLALYPYQSLYFTTLNYGDPYPLFTPPSGKTGADHQSLALSSSSTSALASALPLSQQHVLLLTGIAAPQEMAADLGQQCKQLTPLFFADHHAFTDADASLINRSFEALPSPRIIITTEKDASRLRLLDGLSQEVRERLYVMPVKVAFLNGQEETFNSKILAYVRENSRDGRMAQGAHDGPSADRNHLGNRPGTISFRDS